jgi:hypothetical protein
VNDEELIARARQLAEDGVRSAEAQALARELLRQLPDLAERLDGQVWWLAGKIVDLTGPAGSTHPPDRELMLDVIRQAAAQVTEDNHG